MFLVGRRYPCRFVKAAVRDATTWGTRSLGLAVAESQPGQATSAPGVAGDFCSRSRRAFDILLEKFDLMAGDAERGTPSPQEPFLRGMIFESVPAWFANGLTGLREAATVEEFWRRRHDMADAVIDRARLAQQATSAFDGGSGRILCPLCLLGPTKRIPGSPEGFSIPEGLSRHLDGRSGSQQCSVMRAVTHEVKDSLRRLSNQADEMAMVEKSRRKLVEPSYQTGPDAFVLWDELICRGGARNAQDMEFAEARLVSLGFLKTQQAPGPRITWLKVGDLYRVYADPREVGRIACHLYVKKKASRSDRLSAWKLSKIFQVRDQWTRDVPGKLQAALSLALKQPRG